MVINGAPRPGGIVSRGLFYAYRFRPDPAEPHRLMDIWGTRHGYNGNGNNPDTPQRGVYTPQGLELDGVNQLARANFAHNTVKSWVIAFTPRRVTDGADDIDQRIFSINRAGRLTSTEIGLVEHQNEVKIMARALPIAGQPDDTGEATRYPTGLFLTPGKVYVVSLSVVTEDAQTTAVFRAHPVLFTRIPLDYSQDLDTTSTLYFGANSAMTGRFFKGALHYSLTYTDALTDQEANVNFTALRRSLEARGVALT